jgi:putative membrane protein
MPKAKSFFTEQEKERIRQAVIAQESRTAGEIVPMIVTASARYAEVELGGLILGLACGIVAEWQLSDPWSSHLIHLWPLIGAAIGLVVCRVPPFKRRLIPAGMVADAVHLRCLAAFSAEGLHYTREHTGVLIFVSLFEHRVQVLADRGINEKVSPGTWDEIVQILTAGLKSNTACDAFCKAIERCGEILATYFPRPPDDQDELPNKLVTEP